jgi:hypothetical protein
MKRIYVGLLVLVAAAGSFYAGAFFGFDRGYALGHYNNGLLRAENARRNLAWIEEGKIVSVAGMETSALRDGLLDHYRLIQYPRGFPFPDKGGWVFETNAPHTESYDVIFMRRIEAYAKDHPDVIKFESSGYDPAKLPESSDDERMWKATMISNAQEVDRELAWLLTHYEVK